MKSITACLIVIIFQLMAVVFLLSLIAGTLFR